MQVHHLGLNVHRRVGLDERRQPSGKAVLRGDVAQHVPILIEHPHGVCIIMIAWLPLDDGVLVDSDFTWQPQHIVGDSQDRTSHGVMMATVQEKKLKNSIDKTEVVVVKLVMVTMTVVGGNGGIENERMR